MSEITHPNEPGQYVGDTWFGHPDVRTLPTHWWNGAQWVLDYTPPSQPAPDAETPQQDRGAT